jgi:hypothetical protein
MSRWGYTGGMKLFVDDIRDAPDDSWTVVRKVLPAIRLIATQQVTEISLDHDIENRPSDETFMPVAYFIGEKHYTSRQIDTAFMGSEFCPPAQKKLMEARLHLYPRITIHSVNPVGAKEMAAVLKDYGIEATIEPYKALKAK